MEIESFRLVVFINVLIVLLIITFLLKRKLRKWGYAMMIACMVFYAAIEIITPMIREKNYESFLVEVEKQLIEQYPEKKWTMNQDINLYSFPYDFSVEVIFENEPNVTYQYTLEKDGKLHEYLRTEIE